MLVMYGLLKGTLTAIRDWFRDYKIPDGKPANKFGLGNKAANKVNLHLGRQIAICPLSPYWFLYWFSHQLSMTLPSDLVEYCSLQNASVARRLYMICPNRI